MSIIIYTDGSAKGNPGRGGYGGANKAGRCAYRECRSTTAMPRVLRLEAELDEVIGVRFV